MVDFRRKLRELREKKADNKTLVTVTDSKGTKWENVYYSMKDGIIYLSNGLTFDEGDVTIIKQ